MGLFLGSSMTLPLSAGLLASAGAGAGAFLSAVSARAIGRRGPAGSALCPFSLGAGAAGCRGCGGCGGCACWLVGWDGMMVILLCFRTGGACLASGAASVLLGLLLGVQGALGMGMAGGPCFTHGGRNVARLWPPGPAACCPAPPAPEPAPEPPGLFTGMGVT